MFYRTYRPQSIAQLDNSQVKTIIANILEAPQPPHALLFVGQKGMGKTSTARIFAKAVNCERNKFSGKGVSYEPCNECHSCNMIGQGSAPDVIEQDAASQRGIDEIKSLIKETAFSPMMSRYRVFIIDEAHQITKEAFNALLKTLEEPPAHAIFILATTEEDKIPKTIISRCTRVNFGRAKNTDIVSMLRRVSAAENITLPEETARLIADSADHSFRDATKLLEELTVQKKLTFEEAQSYIGVRSKQSLYPILEKGTVEQALKWVHKYTEAGGNVPAFIEEMLLQLEQQLLSKSGVELDDVPETILLVKDIARLMKALTEAYSLVRTAPIEAVPLEIALVEFYNSKK